MMSKGVRRVLCILCGLVDVLFFVLFGLFEMISIEMELVHLFSN